MNIFVLNWPGPTEHNANKKKNTLKWNTTSRSTAAHDNSANNSSNKHNIK